MHRKKINLNMIPVPTRGKGGQFGGKKKKLIYSDVGNN